MQLRLPLFPLVALRKSKPEKQLPVWTSCHPPKSPNYHGTRGSTPKRISAAESKAIITAQVSSDSRDAALASVLICKLLITDLLKLRNDISFCTFLRYVQRPRKWRGRSRNLRCDSAHNEQNRRGQMCERSELRKRS